MVLTLLRKLYIIMYDALIAFFFFVLFETRLWTNNIPNCRIATKRIQQKIQREKTELIWNLTSKKKKKKVSIRHLPAYFFFFRRGSWITILVFLFLSHFPKLMLFTSILLVHYITYIYILLISCLRNIDKNSFLFETIVRSEK